MCIGAEVRGWETATLAGQHHWSIQTGTYMGTAWQKPDFPSMAPWCKEKAPCQNDEFSAWKVTVLQLLLLSCGYAVTPSLLCHRSPDVQKVCFDILMHWFTSYPKWFGCLNSHLELRESGLVSRKVSQILMGPQLHRLVYLYPTSYPLGHLELEFISYFVYAQKPCAQPNLKERLPNRERYLLLHILRYNVSG